MKVKLRKEHKYYLNFTLVGQLLGEIDTIRQKQQAEIQKALGKATKAKQEKAVEIAKKMLKDKEPVAKIIKFTSLNKGEVQGLRR